MNFDDCYAHSLPDTPKEQWQPLKDHLLNVAEMAEGFAGEFGAGEWASLAGLWHDLGKSTRSWQAYLRKANDIQDEYAEFYEGHPVHAGVGAKWIYEQSKETGKLLAYCIAGHHGGLPNWNDAYESALMSRLEKNYPAIASDLHTPNFP